MTSYIVLLILIYTEMTFEINKTKSLVCVGIIKTKMIGVIRENLEEMKIKITFNHSSNNRQKLLTIVVAQVPLPPSNLFSDFIIIACIWLQLKLKLKNK